MTDIRETIARAIADSICGGHVQWTDLGGRVRESYMGSASAVLSAIEAAGYAVVPREATEASLRAANDAFYDAVVGHVSGDLENSNRPFRRFYRAMIAAAPPLTPEAGKE